MAATNIKARDRIILALDADTLDQAKQLIDELREYVGAFKVGLQLFCNEGPDLFKQLSGEQVRIFFDGKFHDIPNTVARASEAAVACGIWMFNVHASGGARMMKEAALASSKASLQAGLPRPKVIAVTVLTSIAQEILKSELGVAGSIGNHVRRLALLAQAAGLDGVVASAGEVTLLRQACAPDFLLVTPGIRPEWAATDDQARIVTPYQAIACGADYLVVGRPITGAANRVDAARRIVEEMEQAL